MGGRRRPASARAPSGLAPDPRPEVRDRLADRVGLREAVRGGVGSVAQGFDRTAERLGQIVGDGSASISNAIESLLNQRYELADSFLSQTCSGGREALGPTAELIDDVEGPIGRALGGTGGKARYVLGSANRPVSRLLGCVGGATGGVLSDPAQLIDPRKDVVGPGAGLVAEAVEEPLALHAQALSVDASAEVGDRLAQ